MFFFSGLGMVEPLPDVKIADKSIFKVVRSSFSVLSKDKLNISTSSFLKFDSHKQNDY